MATVQLAKGLYDLGRGHIFKFNVINSLGQNHSTYSNLISSTIKLIFVPLSDSYVSF